MIATLTPLGHHVQVASNGAGALTKAIFAPPDLVISDVLMPGMDGWALVRRVRAHPRLAFVPFIFLSALSSADDILRGFRLGADDYLPKPFSPEVLIERVSTALERRQTLENRTRRLIAQDEHESPAALRGSLAEVGLSSLLVLLELEKKSGALELSRPSPNERCRLLLCDGRIYSANVDVGPALLSGAEVVYFLLGWSSGSFEFNAGACAEVDTIGMSTTGLLLEAARRADEQGRGGGDDELVFDE